ncbi:hypothetical protein BaRGS_00024685 [Batillaria attramentaria]|uniref:Peptide hydrolase n=1 Tax=Batillaria attramentaria TaxID=370345 RepID=A0ABD0KAD9_9CAEN
MDTASIRKRNHGEDPRKIQPSSNTQSSSAGILLQEKTANLDGRIVCLFLMLLYGAIWLLIHWRISQFPTPLDPKDAKPSDFVEKRARTHLDKLTQLGPRVAGSASNFAAEKYILGEIGKVKAACNPTHTFEVDVQTVSGTFVMDFEALGIGKYASVYENQKNILVKLGPSGSNDSVLINCHYDTVIDSPGASDDAVSCCVMLEMLRALSRDEKSLRHNILFLFNGAEENILQASHGFITQHRWASTVRAFVNLDSAGAGGWELLFQTGPEHPWLIETYIASTPYPHTSVMGQEIFQSGLVPSDTDFRIFRDYGHIPGLDIAHIRNGYVYHTRNDLPEFVEPGCLQRAGENLLALLQGLVSSPLLTNPGDYRHGSLVFFDFIGMFVVAYPKRLAVVLNWIAIAAVFTAVVLKRLRNPQKAERGQKLVHLVNAIGAVIVTWGVLLLTAVAMALMMTWIGRDMSYFTYPFNIVWLFVLPSVAAAISFHLLLKRVLYQGWSGQEVAALILEANLVVWSVILAVLTFNNIMSAYIPLMLIVFPGLSHVMAKLLKLGVPNDSMQLTQIVIGTALPLAYIMYIGSTVLTFFIPIMGRVGTEEKPDVSISLMTLLPITAVLPFQLGLVYSSHHVGAVIKGLLAVALLGVLAVIFTPLGFPFGTREQSSQQRINIVHADRQFHSKSGEVIKRESSLWLKPFDHKGYSQLEKELPDVFAQAQPGTCEGTYCGRPYLYPMLSRLDARKTIDLPAPFLNVPRVNVRLLNDTYILPEVRRMVFEMTGPDHVTIFFTPTPKAHVVRWTFGHGEPVFVSTLDDVDDTHFIYYAYGEKPTKPFEFSIDFYMDPTLPRDSVVVDMGFSGHYMHGEHQWTEPMLRLHHRLPPWTVSLGWSATYDAFQF